MPDLKRSSGVALAIVLGLLLLLSINVISNNVLRTLRFDLTGNKQYTLNEGTLNVLRKLDEPVRLQFFFSENLAASFPQYRVYGQRVKDLLTEYELRSGGKLQLKFVNPEPFTEDEDDAVALGITGVSTETGDKLYFGLAGSNSIDGRETIPFFSIEREPYLEFDLTSLIYGLSRGDKPVLGILSTIPLEFGVGGPMAAAQGRAQPYVIYDQLLTGFEVENLDQDLTVIPEEIETLMLVHPTGLSSQTLYAIDQFVLRGGHALIFVDPLSEMVQAPSPMGMPTPSGPPNFSSLDPLFDSWGVTYSSQDIVADLDRALRVQSGAGGGQIVDYIVWLGIQDQDLDALDLVTAELQALQLGSAGPCSRKTERPQHLPP